MNMYLKFRLRIFADAVVIGLFVKEFRQKMCELSPTPFNYLFQNFRTFLFYI